MLSWFVALAGCFLALDSCASAADQSLATAVDQLVAKQKITADEPGVAILISQPGRLSFQRGYGLATLEPRQPITPLTLFELASVSKTFTSTAILWLHDHGQLSVDDDIRMYLPELPRYGERAIRIRDLLHHISGLPDYMGFQNVPQRHRGYWDNADYLGEFVRQRRDFPLLFPTGEKYEYNNTNYMLLASIVERVAKKSFGRFMHEEFFAPAGMRHSFVYENPMAVPRRFEAGVVTAIGYKLQKQAWRAEWGCPPARHEELLTVGDGAVWTNLEDMARWDAALRAGRFIKPATFERALTPSKTRDGKTNDYGFGWQVYFDRGKRIGYGHEGAWGGFNTSYYRYLSADRTTVILSNRGSFDPDKFWYALNAVVEKHLEASRAK